MSYALKLKGVKESMGNQAANSGIVGIGGILAALIAMYGLTKIGWFNQHWWAAPVALFFGGVAVRNLSEGIGDGMIGAGAGMGVIAYASHNNMGTSANGPLNAGRAINAGYTNAGAAGGRFAGRMGGRPPIASVAAMRNALSQTSQGTVMATQTNGAGAAVLATMNRARNFRRNG